MSSLVRLQQIARGIQAGQDYFPGCTGKRRYFTRYAATQKGWHVYECEHCGTWHRATSKASKRKGRR